MGVGRVRRVKWNTGPLSSCSYSFHEDILAEELLLWLVLKMSRSCCPQYCSHYLNELSLHGHFPKQPYHFQRPSNSLEILGRCR